MLGVMFTADEAITARMLPPPLEQADMPGGLIFIAEYPETNLGVGYRESALYLRCKYKGENGSHCLSMPITSEPRMHNGRDVFGLPKKLAKIHFERQGNRATGWVERNGVRFVEVEAELTGTLQELPPMGPSYSFKAMPRIDLKPGFDGPVFLTAQRTTIEPKSIEIGTAGIVFKKAEHDPWHELGDVSVLTAFYMVTDNTMLPGSILAEVEPKGYIPHYYRFTDFSSGGKEEDVK
jgi:acetoacetate decarboxylase